MPSSKGKGQRHAGLVQKVLQEGLKEWGQILPLWHCYLQMTMSFFSFPICGIYIFLSDPEGSLKAQSQKE